MILAHELHEPAVHAQHRAHVDLLLGEDGVTFRQNEVRGGVDALGVARIRVGTDSKNLFIGQYDKLFEEYWLSPISYLSPYRG